MLQAAGLTTSFRQELDGAWAVRFGPPPREHMRAVLDRFAWDRRPPRLVIADRCAS